MTEPTDKIFDRIRALIAKSESSEFEGEAEAFASKAAELAMTYAIDLATIGGQTDQSAVVKVEHAMPQGAYPVEKLIMLTGMTKSLGVVMYMNQRYRQSQKIACLIGRQGTVDSLWIIYQSLLVQADSALALWPVPDELRRRFHLAYGPNLDRWAKADLATEIKRGRSAFMVGFTSKVMERWQAKYAEQVEDTPGAGLVLASEMDQALEHLSDTYGKATTLRINYRQ